MTRISFSDKGNTQFERLIGHNESILANWLALENSIYRDSSLEPELLEQVRRTLAFGNHCEYCMVKAGGPNEVKKNEREGTATAFAELFALDHRSIKNGHFAILKEEFTEKEISELCSFIAFITASQKLGSILNLTGDLHKRKV